MPRESSRRPLLVLAPTFLLVFVLLGLVWYFKETAVDIFERHPWFSILLIATMLVSTALLWLGFGKKVETRSWLVLRTIGNLLLIGSIVAGLFLDLDFAFIFPILIAVLILRVLSIRRLTRSLPNSREPRED